MIDVRISAELVPAVLVSAVCIGLYATRLEQMTWRTHRVLCVIAQMLGALSSLAVIVAAGAAVPAPACYGALCAIGVHIWMTEPAWLDAGGPPPETESTRGGLDFLPAHHAHGARGRNG